MVVPEPDDTQDPDTDYASATCEAIYYSNSGYPNGTLLLIDYAPTGGSTQLGYIGSNTAFYDAPNINYIPVLYTRDLGITLTNQTMLDRLDQTFVTDSQYYLYY
jgi:hypothetical protein